MKISQACQWGFFSVFCLTTLQACFLSVILPNSNYKRTTSKFLYVSLCWNIIILWFLNINI